MCGQCGSKTTHISSLTNHYKQFHPNFTAEIKENYSVAPRQQCRQCRKVFTFGKDNLKRHLSRCKGALKNKQGELVLHDSVDLYCSNLRDHCLFEKESGRLPSSQIILIYTYVMYVCLSAKNWGGKPPNLGRRHKNWNCTPQNLGRVPQNYLKLGI